jgi:hypothetical protein
MVLSGAASRSAASFRSEDGGKHWTAANGGLPSLDVHALLRARDGALLAALRPAWPATRAAGAGDPAHAVVVLPRARGVRW